MDALIKTTTQLSLTLVDVWVPAPKHNEEPITCPKPPTNPPNPIIYHPPVGDLPNSSLYSTDKVYYK
ncbi:hypothetical protein U062_00637 [Gammaproteobacteria bacterium MOLA455]|nr:hypothetical protein U062_00637 [Gammaproteobacteria bacterium MOLA455]